MERIHVRLQLNDCRFLKDDNERLICFNRFVENPAKPVAPENSAKPLAPKNSAKPVAPKARSAAPKPVEPRADNKDSFDLWWEWVVSRLARNRTDLCFFGYVAISDEYNQQHRDISDGVLDSEYAK